MSALPEAPRSLWDLLFDGDADEKHTARNLLAEHYQFLVEGQACKLKSGLPSWILVEDLMSYGQIGLLKALEKYNPEMGPFSRFASMRVYGAIIDELRSQDWVPRNLRRDQRSIRQATQTLRNSTVDGEPTIAHLSVQLGWEKARVEATLRKVREADHDSLVSAETYEDESGDVESFTQVTLMTETFVKTLDTLPPEAKVVMTRKYYLEESLVEIAESLQMSIGAVSMMHKNALSQIYGALRGSLTAVAS